MMRSLRTRMMLGVSLLGIASIVAVGVAVRLGASRSFTRYEEFMRIGRTQSAEPDTQPLAVILEGRCCTPESLQVAQHSMGADQLVLVLDEGGNLVASVASTNVQAFHPTQVRRDGMQLSIVADTGSPSAPQRVELRYRLRGIPIHLANGTPATVYAIPIPNPDRDLPRRRFYAAMDRWVLGAMATIALLVVLANWLLTRRILGPIVQVSNAARELGRGDLRHRVCVDGDDEVAALASSFNQMAVELERQHALRRSIVQDVMHELRTPLTALGCRVQSILDGVEKDVPMALAAADRDVEHLTRLVEDLQELAQAEAGELRFAITEIDLRPLIDSAIVLAELRGDERLHVAIALQTGVRGDAVRIRQVLVNVLTNARRYTPADGQINIEVNRDNEHAHIAVTNTGSTLTTEELARVFDRFYRADDSRQRSTGGSGLGLAIVKNLVEAQGGRVWATSDERSVTFHLTLLSSERY